ncbi:hypothetical protein QAA62_26745, partial [Klebsiella pneumoniae]|nr:hypothetical protein [Klebsiella pneumoniae]
LNRLIRLFAGKKSAQIREILISESAWEEMTCLFAPSLVYVLEATVTEERRRLMMEIIYHKCEFVGEMTVVQQAQRQLSLASYERIEQTLKECIAAKLLPANLLTRRAAVLMRSYLSGLMENWLFAPDSFDLHAEARDYVAILLEMYQFCPTLRGPESLSA